MSENKHTPGPWIALDRDVETREETSEGKIARVIAEMVRTPEDAKLIAAAPDLLVALKEVLGNGSTFNTPGGRNAAILAFRAIAKAEGRES